MTTLYHLLQSVWDEQLSGNTSLQIRQFFKFGREKSLSEGDIMSMVIDLEKRNMGLRMYNPNLEDAQDQALYSLAQQSSEASYRASLSLERVKEKKEELIEQGKVPKDEWILKPTSLPASLKEIYSVGGILLTGPVIYVHFYPNSTSDSLIFKFDRDKKKYLYLPRYNIPSVYLEDMQATSDYFQNTDFSQ